MKRFLCLFLTLAMLFSLCACGDDHDHDEQEGQTSERGNQIGDLCYSGELIGISENGQALTTFDPTALGKITVINFWAYWCGPCMRELPAFSQIAEDYGDEVAVVAVHCDNLKKAQETIGESFADSTIRFAMDSDEDNPFAYYEKLGGPGSIPYTVVLDADGVIRSIFTGAIEYDTLAQAIEECRVDNTPIVTTQHQVALQRGNQVGNICYDADLPVITAQGVQTETVDPTAYGKVTVINFWCTTNTPSVAALPYYDNIALKYSEDIKVVAVHGTLLNTAANFIRTNYPDSPIVFLADFVPEENQTEDKAMNEMYRSGYLIMLGGKNNAYPRTIILNEKGIITHVFNQSVTESQLETAVLEALGRM